MKRSKQVTVQIFITAHAFERGKERLGLSEKPFQKMAMKAFISGIMHSETVGELKKFISDLYNVQKNANCIRIYGEVIYLFADNTLITVLHLPNELKKYLPLIKTQK
jgi:hypothetical protein